MKLIDTIRAGNTLGEGVFWDAAGRSVWWTDIEERRLLNYAPQTRRLASFAMPERVGSFALTGDGTRVIAAFESGFALVGLDGGTLDWLGKPDAGLGRVRFNGGRTDRQGRFWAGTQEEAEPRSGCASLYCVDRDGAIHRRESGIQISNGLAWSPDGTTMYFADTPLRTIWRYDFDPRDGTISNRHVFAHTPKGAYPGGATVDADGHLWSAHWGAGMVVRYTPDGAVERVLDVPVSRPSAVAFGGADLDLLFVTSAREAGAAESEPGAGDVFVYESDVKGLAEKRYGA